MKQVKQIICALTSLTMCLCLFGCSSDEKEGSKEETVVETTEQETTKPQTEPATESYQLDETFNFKDITFKVSSKWDGDSGDAGASFIWLEDSSVLTLQVREVTNPDDENVESNNFAIFYAALCDNYELVNEPEYSIKDDIYYMETVCTDSENTSTKVFMFVYNGYSYIFMSTYSINGTRTQMSNYLDDVFSSIEFYPVAETELEVANDNSQSDISLGMKNALSTAKDYLEYSSFSYLGLIDQLEFEKYSHEEAVYGADNCGADWNKQAVDKAKSYIEYSGFSYTGLIEQLEFEQFTLDEAVYGADNCGADWNEQAAQAAQSYMDSMSFSRQELIDQLIFEGFTEEQAKYGAESVGY